MADGLTTYERGAQDCYDAWLRNTRTCIAPIAEALEGYFRHNDDGTVSLFPNITAEDIASVLEVLVTCEEDEITELRALADAKYDAWERDEAVRQGVN